MLVDDSETWSCVTHNNSGQTLPTSQFWNCGGGATKNPWWGTTIAPREFYLFSSEKRLLRAFETPFTSKTHNKKHFRQLFSLFKFKIRFKQLLRFLRGFRKHSKFPFECGALAPRSSGNAHWVGGYAAWESVDVNLCFVHQKNNGCHL